MTGDQLFNGVRALDLSDLAACQAVALTRDWTDSEPKWRLLLTAGEGFGIDDPDGGLAGVVVLTRYPPGVAVVGMLIVADRHARRGLGRALMRHCLAEAGDDVVYLYATKYGRPLYEKLDFHIDGAIVKHAGPFRPDPAPAPAAGARARPPRVRPSRPADRDAVLRLDRAVFGADRTVLLAALGAVADQVVVAEDERGIVGHAAGWGLDGVLTIGPVVARDDAVARALIQAVATGETGTVRVDLPEGSALSRWAHERGLLAGNVVPLMVHCGRPVPGDRDQLCAPVMLGLG